jgi:M6 family metalloprotease-like protein
MQPLERTEFEKLKASGELAKRQAHAFELGNHRIDDFLFKQAIQRTARAYHMSLGMSTDDMDRLMGLMAPPPAWRGMPTTGQVKVFALLIEFTDTTHTNSQATINAALFGNPAVGAPYESLSAYYKRASYNKLTIGGSTLGWYHVDKNRADIAQSAAGRDGIIKQALKYFDKQGHDFKQYDNNGDGVVDYFMVFWAGADNGWGNFWWGYQTSFGDSSFSLDGVRFGDYSWQWESRPVGSAFTPRVVIHETGHALGLPDLYDYDGDKGPDGGVGGADIMDANQFDHNSFSKWVLDWITPTVIGTGEKIVTFKDAGTNQDCVVIWPDIHSNDIFSEFFIVENRQKTGNDAQFPGGGLMVWHIDASLIASGSNYAWDNSYTAHKLVRLMEADGKEDIEANKGFNAGDLYVPGKSFGPNSIPSSNRYNGKSSNVAISNITANGNQITATLSVSKGTAYKISQNWHNLPAGFTGYFDAALNGDGPFDGKCYLFKGDQYIRYDWGNDKADAGYPRKISDAWHNLPNNFTSGFNDAVNGQKQFSGKCYFFKGDSYIRYDWATDKADAGYPKKIAGHWRNLPPGFTSDFDAIINGNGPFAGKCYFFKGDSYVRYDWANDSADPGYPRKIASNWHEMPVGYTNDFNTALEGDKQFANKGYFFKGNYYVRYNWATDQAE